MHTLGGTSNVASGEKSVVVGGHSNEAVSGWSSVAWGYGNTAGVWTPQNGNLANGSALGTWICYCA